MEKFFDRLGFLGLSLVASGVVANQFIFTVDGGERAVIFHKTKGLMDKVYGEGMHFKIPILMEPKNFEIRSRYRLISSATGTKDLQQVELTLRLLFRPQEAQLPRIWNEYGPDYDDKILPSIGNETLKQTVAQYSAKELIQRREEVSQQIRTRLQEKANAFGLILDDVSMTHLQFSRDYQSSIEAKQVAVQEVQRNEFLVEMQRFETEAEVIVATAETDASQLVTSAIQKHGPGLVAMRKIEAAQEITKSMVSNPNITFVNNNTINMLNLNQRN
jgi:prohibitin 1